MTCTLGWAQRTADELGLVADRGGAVENERDVLLWRVDTLKNEPDVLIERVDEMTRRIRKVAHAN